MLMQPSLINYYTRHTGIMRCLDQKCFFKNTIAHYIYFIIIIYHKNNPYTDNFLYIYINWLAAKSLLLDPNLPYLLYRNGKTVMRTCMIA